MESAHFAALFLWKDIWMERGISHGKETKCRAGTEEVFFRSIFDQYDRGASGVSGAVYIISASDAVGGQLSGRGEGDARCIPAGAESGTVPQGIQQYVGIGGDHRSGFYGDRTAVCICRGLCKAEDEGA